MKIRDRRNGFSLLDVIIIVIVTGVVSALTIGLIIFNGTKYATGMSYLDLTNDKALQQFLEVYNTLLDDYYEDINKEELIAGAINGMLEYLGEDYSTYLSESETQALIEKMSGYYKGIGIALMPDRTIDIVYEDSPAEIAGLLVGDEIIAINDTDVTKYSYSDITKLIKTFGDNFFKMTVIREKQEIIFDLKRNDILYPVVRQEIIEENKNKIGYLQLGSFSQTAAIQVEKALNKLEEQEMESLILDLRGNSGGLLTAAKEIANLFLEKGMPIYSLEEKNDITIYKDTTTNKFDKKIIILTNRGSASASEVLAAALKESYGAIIVGEKTYGKGKVQQTTKLDDGTMVKITTAKWLTPTGKCIDGIGIIPDHTVVLPEIDKEADSENMLFEDTQLMKAIDLLVY